MNDWREPLWSSTQWHNYWKDMAPVLQREQPRGAHIADLITPDGCVIEVQHKSMSATEISGRELDHGNMVWNFDARHLYRSGRLAITGSLNGLVTFRWKNHRRTIRSCRRPIFLDLWTMKGTSERVVLKVGQLQRDGRGTAHVIPHHSMRLWISAGIPYRPLTDLPYYRGPLR
ncbi:hypothetical protein EDD96_6831 [Streptomyces sp. Ag109_G2-6]|uniref:hypothetical protein n=1 Tax=Streptomyces TaxID=1883 RepID=UPI0009A4853A|nr:MULTISPECIES: hypothetical protein [Streptomyces]RPF30236.1 hypothetical protein EDD96_6831 [Streptomyces sp. Ag109_G2-6]